MTRAEADAAVLPTLLNALRLPSIGRHWRRITEEADKQGWAAAKLLATLVEIELADRSTRRVQRHRTESGLPLGGGKSFATFDFEAAPGVRKAQLLALASGDGWIESGGARQGPRPA